jgi:hypothetical protein
VVSALVNHRNLLGAASNARLDVVRCMGQMHTVTESLTILHHQYRFDGDFSNNIMSLLISESMVRVWSAFIEFNDLQPLHEALPTCSCREVRRFPQVSPVPNSNTNIDISTAQTRHPVPSIVSDAGKRTKVAAERTRGPQRSSMRISALDQS